MARNQSTGGSRKSRTSSKEVSTSRTGSSGNGKETKNPKTLRELFEEGLSDIYNAEKQLVEALPEVAKAVDNEDLQDAVKNHLEETKKRVERLEKIFNRLNIDIEEGICVAMEGLIEETDKIIDEYEVGPTCDAALIIGMQKIEHYEIAVYGSLCELADVLGYPKIADILDRSLEEEETADHHLTDIAKEVNDEALEMSGAELLY